MAEKREKPKLLELFFVFLRISAVCIGGGYVMFPMMKREVVERKAWISDEELVDYYAMGQSIPGIIAMNTVALIGYRTRGIRGALTSILGMALPSVGIILLIAAFLTPCFDLPVVQKAFAGIRAAVVAMIVMAVVQVGKKSAGSMIQLLIAVAAFLAIAVGKFHPVLVIILGGALGRGLFWRRFR